MHPQQMTQDSHLLGGEGRSVKEEKDEFIDHSSTAGWGSIQKLSEGHDTTRAFVAFL